jgi:two-component system response regulator AlgR
MNTSTNALKLVLIDDEPLARLRTKSLLTQASVANAVVEEFGESVAALMWLREQDAAGRSPDLVLLDIQMPGLDGMTLAARLRDLRRPPKVAFVTAHAEHAVRAFDLAAADYLTKPIRLERLNATLERVAKQLAPVSPQSEAQVQAGAGEVSGEVFVVQDRGRIERIPLSEILYFKAEQKYVTLRTSTHSHVLSDSLTELEGRVGDRFIRVHRNALVARAAMRALERRADEADADGGEAWSVQVRPTLEWLAVSRRQVGAVREAMAQQG